MTKWSNIGRKKLLEGDVCNKAISMSISDVEYAKFFKVCAGKGKSPSKVLREIFRQWMATYATGDF